MFQIFWVCVFAAKYVNAFNNIDLKNEISNEDIKRKMLSYFEHTPWFTSSDETTFDVTSRFNSPVTIIQGPIIERTYRTEISVQQISHPYLFQMMQMIPIKGQIPFQYVYQKLFKYFIALQKFKLINQANNNNIIQILQFVFPELGDKVYEIAKHPLGPSMLKVLFSIIFPGLSPQDLDLIFRDADTTRQLVINLVLYLCPNIRDHFLWKEDLPINDKLITILKILFPGESPIQSLKGSIQTGDFQSSMYTFLDMLFQGKLIPARTQQLELNGPEWLHFQNILQQNQINYQTLPNEFLFYLFANYKTPQFNSYLVQVKEKLNQPNRIDAHILAVWTQFLNDLKTHQKTLRDMPPEIRVFLQQYKNPQELIKVMSDFLDFPVDESKLNIPLDPQIKELWTKFIFDVINNNGDTTHLPKPILDYFNSLSQNPNYKSYLVEIFDTLSINPEMAIKWNNFFERLRDGQTTLDQMPPDVTAFLTNHQHPEDFLRLILKLKDSKIDTNFLNISPNPEMMKLWQKYVEDGKMQNIPDKLLHYFYSISSNPSNLAYIKLLFAPDKINPKTLVKWTQYIDDLKSHRVDLKDMPPEIIQLMLKYKSPDEFFKVLLPQTNIQVNPNVAPDETVKEQWQDWTTNLQNQNVSVLDTPKELKDFFEKISPSGNYQATLREINTINPDLQVKWNKFAGDLRQHKKSMFTMPEDLKKHFLQMKSPKEFIYLIFNSLQPPLTTAIPAPSKEVEAGWKEFLEGIEKGYEVKGEAIDPVCFTLDFSKYLRHASEDINYKHAVNDIYQMDAYVKNELEDLKDRMLHDYNVTLEDISLKMVMFFMKFEDPADMFRSVIAAYTHQDEIKKTLYDEIKSGYTLLWSTTMYSLFHRSNNEIHPQNKLMIKYLTNGTSLDGKIDEMIKLHESNALVNRVEEFWTGTKKGIKVHDGLEVFLLTLERLAHHYGRSEELCEERPRIVEVLDRVKTAFGRKFECTSEKTYN